MIVSDCDANTPATKLSESTGVPASAPVEVKSTLPTKAFGPPANTFPFASNAVTFTLKGVPAIWSPRFASEVFLTVKWSSAPAVTAKAAETPLLVVAP